MKIDLILRRSTHPYDREDEPATHFRVFCEGMSVGTIYLRTNLANDEIPWFWAIDLLVCGPQREFATSGREALREGAMRAFRRSFERVWIAAGEEEWAVFVENAKRTARTTKRPPPPEGSGG